MGASRQLCLDQSPSIRGKKRTAFYLVIIGTIWCHGKLRYKFSVLRKDLCASFFAILCNLLNIFLSGWNTNLWALWWILWKVSASSSYWPPCPSPVKDIQIMSASAQKKISIRVSSIAGMFILWKRITIH